MASASASASSSAAPAPDAPPGVAAVTAVLQSLNDEKGTEEASLSVAELELRCPSLSRPAVGAALNWLAARHRIEFLQDQLTNTLHVRYKGGENTSVVLEKLHDLDVKHRLLFQLIERSGDKGMWARDLRFRSNLQHTEITKILKTLESRKLIKSVTSVAAKNRKVYLLYDLEPSVEVTGDVWYSGSTLDLHFIEIISSAIFGLIRDAGGMMTMREVHDRILEANISKQQLTVDNIIAILNVLLYRGLLELVDTDTEDEDQEELRYRVTGLQVEADNGLTDAPCGTCPVARECQVGALVSPETCPYIAEYAHFAW